MKRKKKTKNNYHRHPPSLLIDFIRIKIIVIYCVKIGGRGRRNLIGEQSLRKSNS